MRLEDRGWLSGAQVLTHPPPSPVIGSSELEQRDEQVLSRVAVIGDGAGSDWVCPKSWRCAVINHSLWGRRGPPFFESPPRSSKRAPRTRHKRSNFNITLS
ncbi:hypothetical protein CDAR_477231 [Caerostris darwini]|uniref:Uncharacterized protein n=1 Tax=Caerostris darwini TaxID=1538125 RepID=A0AAV4TUB1_9ARAC|nr:hypothetical protein CDAR_477231 [Caerostris darwini]